MSEEDDQTDLEETTVEKDLGIWVDNELGFKEHINKVVNKANSTLAIIRRSYTYLDRQSLALLYKALVRPLLEYGNLVWSPYLKGDKEKLEAVQHRATRMIPGLKEIPYEERLKILKLPTLNYRRARGDMIETYKYMHGINKVKTDFLPLSQDKRTRGHTLKLKKVRSITNRRKMFYSQRVVEDWNSLPEEVVDAPTLNCFKNRLDKLWTTRMYTVTDEVFQRAN